MDGTGDVLDGIAGDRNQAGDPLRPKRGDDVGGAAAPVVADEHRLRDRQRIHEVAQIGADGCLLAAARRRRIEEARAAEAAQPGDQNAETGMRRAVVRRRRSHAHRTASRAAG